MSMRPAYVLAVAAVAVAALYAVDGQEAHAATVTSPVDGGLYYATHMYFSATSTSGDSRAVFEWRGETIETSNIHPAQGATKRSFTAEAKVGVYKVWVIEYDSANAAFRSQNVTYEVRDPSLEPVITSPANGATYGQFEPITFTGTNLRGNTPSWDTTGTSYDARGNGVTLRLPPGTYTYTLHAGNERAEVTFTVAIPSSGFSQTGPIVLDWWTTGQACIEDIAFISPGVSKPGYFGCERHKAVPYSVTTDSQGRITDVECHAGSTRIQSNAVSESVSYRCYLNIFFNDNFYWNFAGLTCPEGTNRDCFGSKQATETYPLTCNGRIAGVDATYTVKPLGFVRYQCIDLNGQSTFLTREMKFNDTAKDNTGVSLKSRLAIVEEQGVLPSQYVEIHAVYNGTEWVPYTRGMAVHTDTPKFRGQSFGIESIHVTLNGTKVGGNNIKDDGTFTKGWRHAPLSSSGNYVLEIREKADYPAVLATLPLQIIVPGDPLEPLNQTEPVILDCSPGLGCVERTPDSPPPQEQQQPQQNEQQPPPPTNSTQQQTQPQQPPQPAKSASVTLIHDGTSWIQFEDGMTIQTQAPKFRGQTENLESIHITLNGTKVGGSKVSDTGSFWKSWKHDPLIDGTYSLEIRESSGTAVLWSATVRIVG